MTTSPRTARRAPPSAARAASIALAAALALAGCETVDERARDPRTGATSRLEPTPRFEPSRAAAASRDAGRDAPAGGQDGASQAESDQRRRAQIRLELGAGYYQQRQYAQAIEELRSALAVEPQFAAAYGLLGLVYMEIGETARAEESFQRALRITPDESDLLNNYGWFLCQTERPREALAQFAAELRNPLYPTPAKPLHNAGICSLRVGDEAGAEGYFQRAFQLDARNPVAMYHLGELYLKRGDLERARFHSQRLLSLYPPSAETLWLAVRVERRADDRDAVASLSAQLRRQFPASREANLLQRGAFGE